MNLGIVAEITGYDVGIMIVRVLIGVFILIGLWRGGMSIWRRKPKNKERDK